MNATYTTYAGWQDWNEAFEYTPFQLKQINVWRNKQYDLWIAEANKLANKSYDQFEIANELSKFKTVESLYQMRAAMQQRNRLWNKALQANKNGEYWLYKASNDECWKHIEIDRQKHTESLYGWLESIKNPAKTSFVQKIVRMIVGK